MRPDRIFVLCRIDDGLRIEVPVQMTFFKKNLISIDLFCFADFVLECALTDPYKIGTVNSSANPTFRRRILDTLLYRDE
ncbi:hypothetical protein FHG68_16690 [Leptospira weilii]|nr:hypothetical protein FHG67_16645 [Leptospira weilii]QDK28126.1 hypothetical protein FHG68_16690 [Leptospira weilii]